jgi:hypothetical protein
MDFIEEIEALFDACDRDHLVPLDIALWLVLMHINRKAGWTKEFTASSSALRVKVGLPETTFKEARKRLVEKGFIEYQKVGNHLSKYRMKSNIIVDKSDTDSAQLKNDYEWSGSLGVDEKSYLSLKQRFNQYDNEINGKEKGEGKSFL